MLYHLFIVCIFVVSTNAVSNFPPPIKAVWPVKWVSKNYTGEFPLGPSPYDQVTLVGTWYYDWPKNSWRQDTCIKMTKNATASCKIELWKGNDHTAGSSTTGTTYVFNQDDGTCTYAPSMVPAVTHPDSFADGIYSGRLQLDDGKWGDKWTQNTASWIHYNFSTTMNIETGAPLRDCGPTSPTPPYAYACSNHHTVHYGSEYTEDEWKSFFALDTSKCKSQVSSDESHTLNPIRSFVAMSSLLS